MIDWSVFSRSIDWSIDWLIGSVSWSSTSGAVDWLIDWLTRLFGCFVRRRPNGLLSGQGVLLLRRGIPVHLRHLRRSPKTPAFRALWKRHGSLAGTGGGSDSGQEENSADSGRGEGAAGDGPDQGLLPEGLPPENRPGFGSPKPQHDAKIDGRWTAHVSAGENFLLGQHGPRYGRTTRLVTDFSLLPYYLSSFGFLFLVVFSREFSFSFVSWCTYKVVVFT